MLNSVNLGLASAIFILFLTDFLRFQKQGTHENTFSAGVPAYFTGTTVCLLRQVGSKGNHFPRYCLDWSSDKCLEGCFANLSWFFAFTVGLEY